MQQPVDLQSAVGTATELDAIILQMAITLGVAILCTWLFARYRKPVYGAWATTWALYVMRLVAILAFLLTGAAHPVLLYWHQVITGWTGIGVLATALVFSRRFRWRKVLMLTLLFPPVWSYIAIYRLDRFLLAALPAVIFLSAATLWTGMVFWHYARRTHSPGAKVLAVAFIAWGIHHLDYPFLRAYGAWAPWGYYLDIIFTLTVATGILLLVADELRSGVVALSTLNAEQATGPAAQRNVLLDGLLSRAVAIPAVSGAAVYGRDDAGLVCERGAGICREWTGTRPVDADARFLERALDGQPRAVLASSWTPPVDDNEQAEDLRFAAVIPVHGVTPAGATALVVVSEGHDPFAALDEDFLTALGRQVGSTLALSELNQKLVDRGSELSQLSARIVIQQEEERRKLSRELHDETAQLLSAVKIELAKLRESLPAPESERVDDALALTDAGIRSIRAVIEGLRPTLLDDLGLIPALRSLASSFSARSGREVAVEFPEDGVPQLSPDAELAVYRVLQEALSNVARHSGSERVWITLSNTNGDMLLSVADDGRGPGAGAAPAYPALGIVGMRERVAALGGSLELRQRPGGGALLETSIPLGRNVVSQ